MRRVIVQYRREWLLLLVPSLLILLFLAASDTRNPEPAPILLIAVWAVVLCITLPIARDYWSDQVGCVYGNVLSRLTKGRSKEQAEIYEFRLFLTTMIIWVGLIGFLGTNPLGQIIFVLVFFIALLFPVVSLFIHMRKGVSNA